MTRRILLLLLVAGLTSCGNFGGRTETPHTGRTVTVTVPLPESPKPETRSDADAVKTEIERMDMRLRGTADVQPLPPELTRASPNPVTTAPPSTPVAPTGSNVTTRRETTLTDLIAALEAKSDLTPEEQFRLKVLKALARSDDRDGLMTRLYTDVGSGDAQAWHVIRKALDTCAQGKPDETLARLREAEEMLKERSSLKLSTPVFCVDTPTQPAVQGLGLYNPRANTSFSRGEMALVYMEVSDFDTQREGSVYKYHLKREMTLLDLAGREAHRFNEEGGTFTIRTPLDVQSWPKKFTVPDKVYAGEYILRITVTDEFKKRFAEAKVEMTIR